MSSLIPHNNQSLITQRDITLLSPIIATYGSVERFCNVFALSKNCPTHLQNKAVEIQLMIAYGLCFGLAPFAAIKNVMILNNIPSLYGDAVTAMCYATRQLRKLQVDIKHTDDLIEDLKINDKPAKNIIATCKIIREGIEEITTSFSLLEAHEAGLLFAKDRNGKEYPKAVWHKYTTRMLAWRAKTYAIREAFPDKLVGLTTFEELIDYPDVNYDGEIVFNENGSARLVPKNSNLNRKTYTQQTNNNLSFSPNPTSEMSISDTEEAHDAEIIDEGMNIPETENNASTPSENASEDDVKFLEVKREKVKGLLNRTLEQFQGQSIDKIEERTMSEKYQAWITDFTKEFPDLVITYQEKLSSLIEKKIKEKK